MLVVFSPIFVADTERIFGYNFVDPLRLDHNKHGRDILLTFKIILMLCHSKIAYFVMILKLPSLR